jgi:hypothetical protein
MFRWIGDDQRAELLDLEPIWNSAERYSLAERADANSKFQDIPFRSRMSLIGQFTPAEVATMEAERAGEQLLIAALTQTPAEPEQVIEGEVVERFRDLSNGDVVEFAQGIGQVEHIMLGGVLGLEGSSYAVEATETNPALQVRLWERSNGAWQPTPAVYGTKYTQVKRLDGLPN